MSEDTNPIRGEEGSALQRHLGYKLTEWRNGFARFDLPMSEFIMNRQGLPHGGVHATLLDTAMGYAGCFTGDAAQKQMALTLSLTVNYLGQASGDILIAEGRVTGGGRRTYFAEGQITDSSGAVIATATGVFRYLSDKST